MTKLIRATLVAGALATGGCGAVLSNAPTLTNTNGDAWYTEGTGFMGMFWGSHVYYCPAPSNGRNCLKSCSAVAPMITTTRSLRRYLCIVAINARIESTLCATSSNHEGLPCMYSLRPGILALRTPRIQSHELIWPSSRSNFTLAHTVDRFKTW